MSALHTTVSIHSTKHPPALKRHRPQHEARLHPSTDTPIRPAVQGIVNHCQ
jgi:hypothetical protein